MFSIIRHNLKKLLYKTYRKQYRLILKSGLFDEKYYLKQDPEIDSYKIDPLIHYINVGWREGCNPNELFCSAWYIKQNPDSAGMDPLLHYVEVGWREGRDPNPYFSTAYYIKQYPESIKTSTNPLAHYLNEGWLEGKKPNPFFDSYGYLAQYPDVKAAGMNPLTHYINFGADEGRRPIRFFDPEFYRNKYCNADLSLLEAFLHYDKVGSKKHHRPWALFDPEYYADVYPEYFETDPFPLGHYQKTGIYRGLYPCREVAELTKKPVISIVTPVYNIDALLLKKCIHSVLYQAYPHWELCLVNDGSRKAHIRRIFEEYGGLDKRIKTVFLDENKGISEASNAGGAMATGDYIGFLDHDDELTLNALYEVAKAINNYDPDILYSDEDLINSESGYLDRFYKPDFNPELLMSHNYITHLLVTKRELFEKVDGFSKAYDGAQDYDLALKLTEHAQKVHHIDQAIYQWRAIDASTSINHTQKDYADAAGRKAVESALLRRRIDAAVYPSQLQYYYQIEKKVMGQPTVALLVALNDCNAGTINRLYNLIGLTQYPKLELHCLFFSGITDKMRSKLNGLALPVIVNEFDDRSNMARALNRSVTKIDADHLIFLDPSIKMARNDWIEILLGYSQDHMTGAVGGLVHYVNGRVPEINALPNIKNDSWQYYRDFFQMCSRHLNGLHCPQNVLAISTDFCMVKRSSFKSVKGFEESGFPTVMYDFDFCLRLKNSGVENVYTPYCEAVCERKYVLHIPDDVAYKEIDRFQERWRTLLVKGDPYYNLNKIFNEKQITRDEWLEWFAGIKTS